ncbi:MAG TPA: hypothetical protein VGO78_24315 [Acidimicrobiales bacterium]|nr:hypothetical protein [Acidimicrobiales bacterium]
MSNLADGPAAAMPDGGVMTYVLVTNSTTGDPETFQAISDRVEEHAHGLVARYAGINERGLAVTTVWESKAHADRFTVDHLLPAIRELAPEADQQAEGPLVIEYDAFDQFPAATP